MHPNHKQISIGIIGAGRLASALGLHLFESNIPVQFIYSKTGISAQQLASKIHSKAINDLEEMIRDLDLLIIAVNDDAIHHVAEQISKFNTKALVVHCSGATPLAALSLIKSETGVFYPLQSFSEGQIIDFSKIPICIDASSNSGKELIIELATQLNCKYYLLNDDQRLQVHLAAVFANNFSNALFAIAKEILEVNDLPFDLIQPLIEETVHKILIKSPKDAQTGPAKRGDLDVIRRHLVLLQDHPDWADIYKSISHLINPDLKIPQ